ncbi:MAG: stage V sporulation protein D [Clostridiaceae bacterium]
MAKKEYVDKAIIKRRMFASFSILSVLFFLLISRLIYLMIVDSKNLTEIAKNQWTKDVKISAKRGSILDRNGNEIAISANVYRVDLDMNTLRSTVKKEETSFDEMADKLAIALSMEKEDVLKILNSTLPSGLPLSSATLARRIEKDAADKVNALDMYGVMVSEDTKRYYPNNDFLAQVIGHTNSDGDGLTGIELEYNKELSGVSGVRISEMDTYDDDMPYAISEYSKPINGYDVVLTIDEMIQYFCEKSAKQAMIDNKASAVTIIAMDPNNGEILAMANEPSYDLNDPWVEGKTYDELQQSWRNRAVSDIFEPGSIFKVITSAAALSEGLISDSDTFDCHGSLNIDGRNIRCWKTSGHGEQTFAQILQNSCNVGFMMVGAKVGAENLNKYIKKFGLGQKTGIDLPGEASGIIKKTADISNTDLATISFGQTDTVTCVQYLTAFNAVANGGDLITPHVMKEIVSYDENGEEQIVEEFKPEVQNVLTEDVSSQLRGLLEQVISQGGGSKTYIEGYHIAGKTGTAQVVQNGVYASGKYISSFVGMAPADNPKITILVSIVEPDPSNYYAGQIATPVAKQVFYDIFNYKSYEVDADESDVEQSLLKDIMVPEIRGLTNEEAKEILKNEHLDFELDGNGDYITNVVPVPGYSVKEGTKLVLYTGEKSNYNNEVAVPNLIGHSKENAIEVLNQLGLKSDFTGTGVISEQNLEPGTEVLKGSTVYFNMDILGD